MQGGSGQYTQLPRSPSECAKSQLNSATTVTPQSADPDFLRNFRLANIGDYLARLPKR